MLAFYLIVAEICWLVYEVVVMAYFIHLIRHDEVSEDIWMVYRTVKIDPNKLSGCLLMIVFLLFGGVIEAALWPIELPAKIFAAWQLVKESREYESLL